MAVMCAWAREHWDELIDARESETAATASPTGVSPPTSSSTAPTDAGVSSSADHDRGDVGAGDRRTAVDLRGEP